MYVDFFAVISSTLYSQVLQMEQTGSTLFQTLAGILLDTQSQGGVAYQPLLDIFVVLNVFQCGSIILLAYLQYRRNLTRQQGAHTRQNSVAADEAVTPGGSPTHERLLTHGNHNRYTSYASIRSTASQSIPDIRKNPSEVKRGVFFASASIALVVFAWILFLVTAWRKLGQDRPQH